jgi:hypothetical protein
MRAYKSISSLFLLLAAWGCQTESVLLSPQETTITTQQETRLRLKQMVVNGDNGGLGPYYVTTRFAYKQDRLLKQAVFSPNSPNPAESTYEYSYDQQGRVSSYLVNYEKSLDNGNTGERHTFNYQENSFEYKAVRVGSDGQPLPSQVNNQLDIYRTNQDGQLVEWIQEGIIRYDRPTRARYVYSYANGNIIKATYLNGDNKEEFTVRYEYDDKLNPFYEWMYTIDPVLRYSRNNVVSAQINNSTPFKTEYTYNEQGLPLTKKDVTKGAVLTYEYESF